MLVISPVFLNVLVIGELGQKLAPRKLASPGEVFFFLGRISRSVGETDQVFKLSEVCPDILKLVEVAPFGE